MVDLIITNHFLSHSGQVGGCCETVQCLYCSPAIPKIMENGLGISHASDDLAGLSSALVSSSTKRRRAELSDLRQNLSDSGNVV